MNKNTIIAIGIAIAVLAVGLGAYYFWNNQQQNKLSPTQELEAQLKKLIIDNVENWAQYEKTTDAKYKKFGNDPSCQADIKGSEDFLSYHQKTQEGDVYKLDLASGAYMAYTPNYNNWDHAKLASFGVKDMRICSGGWLTPLYAYPDKIVWGNIQCFGAEEEADNCLRITQIIMGYYTNK